MTVDEIRPGIYIYQYTGDRIIAKFEGRDTNWGSIKYIDTNRSTYSQYGAYSWNYEFSLATEEEKFWLLACIAAGEFVPRDEVIKAIYEIY